MSNLEYYAEARKRRDKRMLRPYAGPHSTTGTTAIVLFLRGNTSSPDVHPHRDSATFSLKCYVTYGRFGSKAVGPC